jgi:hypothetical protein
VWENLQVSSWNFKKGVKSRFIHNNALNSKVNQFPFALQSHLFHSTISRTKTIDNSQLLQREAAQITMKTIVSLLTNTFAN